MATTLEQVSPEAASYDATVLAPKYDAAVESRDVPSLIQSAKDNIDTPASGLFLRAAKIIDKNQKEFQSLTAPIDQKGGTQTPDGRMEIVKQFETTADRPMWGTALLKYVMGDKAGAVKQITGGDITTKITYDNGGNQIEEKVNELGEPVSYFDRKSGRMLTKEEYANRVGGISSWSNTLYGLTEAERRKQNLATEQNETAQTNYWTGLTQSHAGLWKQIHGTLNQMKSDLPSNLYNQIIETTSSSAGQASSRSKSDAILNQLNDAASRGEGTKLSDTVAAELGGRGKILQIKGDRVVSTDGSFNESINKLRQKQSTESQNAEATSNAQKTRESILEAKRLGQLTDAQANQLKFVLDASQRIGKETMEAVDKFGKPSFISLPSTSSMVDKQAQFMAQALQGMHNAEQMMVYKNYRDDALQGYRQANQLPSPGEIAAQYSKTGGFKDLQDFYSNEIGNVLSKSYSAKPEQQAKTAKPAAQGGAAPQQKGEAAPAPVPFGVPYGSVKTGKFSNTGAPVYKAPDGSLHIPD
jgi:hypothetical protein